MAAGNDGRIYVTGQDGTIFCLNDKNEIIWVFYGDYQYASSPVIGDSLIYFTGFDQKFAIATNLYAIDLDGGFRWKFGEGRKYDGLPMVSPSGEVYIVTEGEFSFNNDIDRVSKNGTCIHIDWADDISNGILLGFDFKGNLIVWKRADSWTRCISKEGTTLVSCRAHGKPFLGVNPPEIADRVFYSTEEDLVVAMNINCGFVWRNKERKYEGEGIAELLYSTESQAIFLGSTKGTIYTLKISDGSALWSCDIGDEFGNIDRFAYAAGFLFVACSRGFLIAIEESGRLVWNHEMYNAGWITDLSANSLNELFVLQDGCLYQFSTGSSQIVAEPPRIPPPSDSSEAEDEIVQFMLEDITGGISILAGLIQDNERRPNMPQLSPPREDLIIHAQVKHNKKKESSINYDKLLQAWTVTAGKITKVDEASKIISAYSKQHEKEGFIPWTYGKYIFGIESISPDHKQAVVLLDHHCGRLCGDGSRLYLQRSPSGKWWIVDRDETWIS